MPGVGTFAGYASVFNLADLAGEVVMPRAFVNLTDFRARGLALWNHDSARPCGMITTAREDEVGLWIAGTFHGTEDGTTAHRVISERQAAGLQPYGLSIGYLVLGDHFDSRRGVRLLKRIALLEVSFVALPANPAAAVREVKLGPPRLARSGPPRAATELQVRALLEEARFLGVPIS